jgi:hypothetical protein
MYWLIPATAPLKYGLGSSFFSSAKAGRLKVINTNNEMVRLQICFFILSFLLDD